MKANNEVEFFKLNNDNEDLNRFGIGGCGDCEFGSYDISRHPAVRCDKHDIDGKIGITCSSYEEDYNPEYITDEQLESALDRQFKRRG